jgi:hypothetical protein
MEIKELKREGKLLLDLESNPPNHKWLGFQVVAWWWKESVTIAGLQA